MTDDMLAKLMSIDPEILADVVRQDQRSPSFDITEWSVKRLSDKGIRNPDGLWLFSGKGRDGERSQPWSVVLKILERQEQEPPPDNFWYWKRELLLVQSGVMEHLPGPVKAPRFYKAEETLEGAWLWLEYIDNHRPDPWVLDDYAFVAHQLGYWNGVCAASPYLADEPWLARHQYRYWYTQTNPERDLHFPLNQKYILGDNRKRYEQLWAERELFYHALESLPQSFSHFDSQRRNLLIRGRNDEQDELVLLDWAVCGLGPLGAELLYLVGMSATLLDWSPSALEQLDAATFGRYLQGLRQSGWSGDADVIRLGYAAWMTAWLGIILPNAMALWCTPDFRSHALQHFGCAEEELYRQWLPVFHYALDRADEARVIIQHLHLV